MAYDNIQPIQKRTEYDYLKGLKALLPQGWIWRFPMYLIREILQDIISNGPDPLQDIPADGSEVLQDVINEGGSFSSILGTLLSCFAAELLRLDNRANDLLRESSPGLSVELLPRWEKVAGLPDRCNQAVQTLEERQIQAHIKLRLAGEVTTTQFYINIAADLGFTIEIDTEYYNTASVCGTAICGVSPCGDGFGVRSGVMLVKVLAGVGTLDAMQCTFYRVQSAHFIIIWEDLR